MSHVFGWRERRRRYSVTLRPAAPQSSKEFSVNTSQTVEPAFPSTRLSHPVSPGVTGVGEEGKILSLIE